MRYIASTLLFLLVACGSDSAKTAEPEHKLPVEKPYEEGEGIAPETAEPTAVEDGEKPVSDGEGDSCVKDCVAARQMQATSIETIELDCAKECNGDAADLPK